MRHRKLCGPSSAVAPEENVEDTSQPGKRKRGKTALSMLPGESTSALHSRTFSQDEAPAAAPATHALYPRGCTGARSQDDRHTRHVMRIPPRSVSATVRKPAVKRAPKPAPSSKPSRPGLVTQSIIWATARPAPALGYSGQHHSHGRKCASHWTG